MRKCIVTTPSPTAGFVPWKLPSKAHQQALLRLYRLVENNLFTKSLGQYKTDLLLCYLSRRAWEWRQLLIFHDKSFARSELKNSTEHSESSKLQMSPENHRLWHLGRGAIAQRVN